MPGSAPGAAMMTPESGSTTTIGMGPAGPASGPPGGTKIGGVGRGLAEGVESVPREKLSERE